ncbi:MAG TPA: molybdate ABC transporter substrate-binding protein [Burkholderiales bacterium]|nr:molybdate ABC transporter substrate-binding protein [Burkholderiales bacterium]
MARVKPFVLRCIGAALIFMTPALSLAVDITVSAASSLTNAFAEIGKAYEKAKPGTKVLFNFGASGALLQQLSRGAPVDVFASADVETMDRAEKQNLLVPGTRTIFASNRLVVIVAQAAGSIPASLDQLASPAVKRIAIGIPDSVPVGRYAKAALEKANLWTKLEPKLIFTQNVRQSLDYVSRGEVDAGFAYATDAAVVPDRVHIAFEVPTQAAILYPIAAVKGNGEENAARDFVRFVQSQAGQQILAKFGFGKP